MGWRIERPNAISESDWKAWGILQESRSDLCSPYFHPEFTRAVAVVRPNVEVAIHDKDGVPIAFFPFERLSNPSYARPVGGWLSDFHGIISSASEPIDPGQLLRACGLTAWSFTHLPAAQTAFAKFSFTHVASPYMDLADGFEAYRNALTKHRRDELAKRMRVKRKVEREAGPVRVQFDSADADILDTLISWKSNQYQRAGLVDIFRYAWTGQLLHNLLAASSPDFRGLLSTLHIGNRLAAAHFGLYSRGILHYWFPGYDTTMSHEAPGNILLLELIQQCEEVGLKRIEFGKGETRFKTSLMSGADVVCEGRMTTQALSHTFNYGLWQAKRWLQRSPIFRPIRYVKHELLGWDGRHGIQ